MGIKLDKGEIKLDFKDLVKKRYSVRKYKEKDVERETLEGILETTRNAPSAMNIQPVKFIVVTDPKVKEEVAETYPLDWINKAPVIIVACGDHSESWVRDDGKDYCDVDVAISVDHLTLAAVDQGLGTCWVCAFDKEACIKALDLPENLEPIAIIPMGYPIDQPIRDKKRKSLDETVSFI